MPNVVLLFSLDQFHKITHSNHPTCNNLRHNAHSPGRKLRRLPLNALKMIAASALIDHLDTGLLTDLELIARF